MLLIDPLYVDIDASNVDQTEIVVATAVNQNIAGNKTFTGTTAFSGNVAFDTNLLFVDATNNKVLVGATSSTIGAEFQVTSANVAGTTQGAIFNSDNTNNSSAAQHYISVGGTTAGDPTTRYVIPGGQSVTTGLDNSDGDKLKFSRGSVLGTNDLFQLFTATGEFTTTTVDPPTANWFNNNSMARAWIAVTEAAGVYTDAASYNVFSISKNGTGSVDVNWDTDFTGANSANSVTVSANSSSGYFAQSAGGSRLTTRNRVIIWDPITALPIDGGFDSHAFGVQ